MGLEIMPTTASSGGEAIVDPDPTVDIVTVSPDEAKRLAATADKANLRAKQVNWRRVERYANDMRAGTFGLSNTAIVVDPDGNLSDGLKRCLACVSSNRPFQTIILRGKASDFNFDSGLPRTLQQWFRGRGEDEPSILAGTVRAAYRLYSGEPMNRVTEGRVGIQQQMALLDRFPGIRDSVSAVACRPIGGPDATYALAHYAIALVDRELADAFLNDAQIGSRAGERNPARHLRLAIEGWRRAGIVTWETAMPLAIKAANAYVSGKDVGLITYKRKGRGEKYPDFDFLDFRGKK